MIVRAEILTDHTLVIPEGRIDFESAPEFQSQLERAIAATHTGVVVIVDCSALEYVSSAGLRAFLLGARAAQRAATPFALSSLRPAVREVFELSGFNKVIPIYPDRETARAQSRPSRT
jgi:anti-anti-sigma factor